MESGFFQLLLFGVAAGLANVLGGLILVLSDFRVRYRSYLKYLLAVGAGFMLSVTFFEIVPKTILIWQQSSNGAESLALPMVLLLGGYLLTQVFEHTVAPHFHLGEDFDSSELISGRSAYSAVAGLLIHTFFDGVSIAAAAQIDLRIGFLVFIAVALHKFPEGFTIGSMLLAAGRGRRDVLAATALIGFMTLVGAVLYYLAGAAVGFTARYALPIACGVTLYVAASDLIPEVNHHGGKRPYISLSIFTGVGLFFLLHYMVVDAAIH
jgi:zinc transporter ZupT